MKTKIFLILALFISTFTFAQQITGKELLEKSIAYHDPDGNWSTFKGNLMVTMESPNKPNRDSDITIDIPNEYFSVKATTSGKTTEYVVDKGNCSILYNGETPSEEIKKKNNLSCERANLYKNYYTYLYGLPMKLNDPGTIIHEKTLIKNFKGKTYLVLKITYDADVGSDIWYFYFDPTSYALEIYQFFKSQKENDGEYIILEDIEILNGIKIPKNRSWYYNKDNGYLGTDIIKKVTH